MEEVLTLDIVENMTVKTHQIEWIDVQVPRGNFIIGPGHSPLASLLRRRGTTTYKVVAGDIITCQTLKGTVTVVGDRVTLIIEN